MIGLGGWIVLQKREPVATLSWLLGLAALPVVGLLVYQVVGPQKIRRHRLRRSRSRMPRDQFAARGGDQAAALAPLRYDGNRLHPTTAQARATLGGGAAARDSVLWGNRGHASG